MSSNSTRRPWRNFHFRFKARLLDSPWYPTARLFRQRTPRDWEHVFAEVERELAAMAAARPRSVVKAPPRPAAAAPVRPTGQAPAAAAGTPPAAGLVVAPASSLPDVVVPSAFTDAGGRPRFAMPIPGALREDAGLRVLAREEVQDGGFEHATRRFFDEHLQPGDLFVDVGADLHLVDVTQHQRGHGRRG